MRCLKYTLVAMAVATLGLSNTAEARDSGWRDGRQRQHSPIDQRVNPRKFSHYVDQRQATQRARIRNGRHHGQLTGKERRWLRADQKRIARMEREFAADGYYSRYERRLLSRALDRASHRIKRARHDPRHYRYHTHHRRWDNWGQHGLRGRGSPRHPHRHNRLSLSW